MSKIQKYETISFRLEKFLDFGLNYGKRKRKIIILDTFTVL